MEPKFKIGDRVRQEGNPDVYTVAELIQGYRCVNAHSEMSTTGGGLVKVAMPTFQRGDRVKFKHERQSDIGLVLGVCEGHDTIRIYWLDDEREMEHSLDHISQFLTKE